VAETTPVAPAKVAAKPKKVAQNATPVVESNDAIEPENIALASGFSRRSAAVRNKKVAAAAAAVVVAAEEEQEVVQAQEQADDATAAPLAATAPSTPASGKKQRRKAYVAEPAQEDQAEAAPVEPAEVAQDEAEQPPAEEAEGNEEDEEEAPVKKARKPRKKSEGPTQGALKRGKRKVNDTEKAIDKYIETIAQLPADERPAYVSTFFEKSFNVKTKNNDVSLGPIAEMSDRAALMAMALEDTLDSEIRGAKSIIKDASNLFEPAIEFARTGDYPEGTKRKLNGAYNKYSGQAAEANEYLTLLGDRNLSFTLRRNGSNRIVGSPGVPETLNSVRMDILPLYLNQLQAYGADCLSVDIRNAYTHRILSENAWKTLGDVANEIQTNAVRDANQGALQDLQDLFLFVAAGGTLADIDLGYSDRSTKKKANSTGNPNKRRKID
jgi:hypothetical protein